MIIHTRKLASLWHPPQTIKWIGLQFTCIILILSHLQYLEVIAVQYLVALSEPCDLCLAIKLYHKVGRVAGATLNTVDGFTEDRWLHTLVQFWFWLTGQCYKVIIAAFVNCKITPITLQSTHWIQTSEILLVFKSLCGHCIMHIIWLTGSWDKKI